jgi:hypothetical protein
MSKHIFCVASRHPEADNQPPEINNDDPNVYIGYYQNEHGEQWIFTFDRRKRVGVLRGGDIDWTSLPVVDVGGGPHVDTILNDGESSWLRACWNAATAFS